MSGGKFFRCNGTGHKSNVCPHRGTGAIPSKEDVEDDEHEYPSVEFAEEDSEERVNVML